VARRRIHRPLRDRSVESELKFRVSGPRDHTRLRAELRKRGAQLDGRYVEENYRFNGPGKSTRNVTLRLRVLDGGPRGMLTVKGPARFVEGVKRRSVWKLDGVSVTLDVLDFGWFVELEGPLEALPDMARRLGLDPHHAVKESYSVLARKFLASKKKKKVLPPAVPVLSPPP
jgi:adenylate cyclase class IV